MKFPFLFRFIVLAVFPGTILSQDLIEESGYLRHPVETASGIAYTDNLGSTLHLLRKDGTTIDVAASPGCGNYFTLSPDRRSLGFKLITAEGQQRPAFIDLETGALRILGAPGTRIGQVSFALDGRYAFTEGNDLVVSDGKRTRRFDLGSYANIAPISPDGTTAAFNDSNDQLWILDLLSGKRYQITDGAFGYFNPTWSPDGQKVLYTSLNGVIKVYDQVARRTYTIGDGFDPSWSNNSRFVVFDRRIVDNLVLVNSDLYLSLFDGSSTVRLTNSEGTIELDPSFSEDGTRILYQTYARRELCSSAFVEGKGLDGPSLVLMCYLPSKGVNHYTIVPSLQKVSTSGMPYVNQVYDTPDWFNGNWACGPTTAIMVLGYYHILPRWEAMCSWPARHVSPYGRYVCERYFFKQRDYVYAAADPNGTSGYGGFGYMWAGSNSPHSTMQGYYAYHGLQSTLTDGPSHGAALAEIQTGAPYSICVGLTTAGHIVAAFGIGAEPHTIIVNDPYGNKNLPGYPNPNGANSSYDWPGYNNGFQNLNQVYWSVTAHGAPPAPADSVVDDVQIDNGFYLNAQAPASMSLWKDLNRGYGGHMWYTYTRTGPADTCYATWTAQLSMSGRYEVFAYVSISNATAATYLVRHRDGDTPVTINQKEIHDSWISLGTYWFEQGNADFVRLGDASPVPGQELAFDAMRWAYRGDATTSISQNFSNREPEHNTLQQNYPNPFNPTTVVSYQLSVASEVRLVVYDLLGQEVAVLVNGLQEAGTHSIPFDGSALPSGLYLYRLEAGRFKQVKSMMLLK